MTRPLLLFLLALLGCEQAGQGAKDLSYDATHGPEWVYCGWTEARPFVQSVPEAEPGMCWIVGSPERTTTELGTDPCDVTGEVKIWPGGAMFEVWAKFGSPGDLDLPVDPIECEAEL